VTLRTYLRSTHPALLAFDLGRLFVLLSAPLLGLILFRWLAATDVIVAPLHRRLCFNPAYATAGTFYRAFIANTFFLTAAWVLSAGRTFLRVTLTRAGHQMRRRDP